MISHISHHLFLEYDVEAMRPLRLSKQKNTNASIEFILSDSSSYGSNLIMLIIGDEGSGASILDYQLLDSNQGEVHIKFQNPYFLDAAAEIVNQINTGIFNNTDYAPFYNFKYNNRNYQITVLSL